MMISKVEDCSLPAQFRENKFTSITTTNCFKQKQNIIELDLFGSEGSFTSHVRRLTCPSTLLGLYRLYIYTQWYQKVFSEY